MAVEVRQTDSESELVGWLHEAADDGTPVVLNPAAFTHYSYALRDACAQLTAPLVEVHITNPHAREEFRHTSVISAVATGVIAGFGLESYRLALRALISPARCSCPWPLALDWCAAARGGPTAPKTTLPRDRAPTLAWQPPTTSRTAWFSTSTGSCGPSSGSSTTSPARVAPSCARS